MKRAFLFVLSACFILGLFAACEKEAPPAPPETTDAAETPLEGFAFTGENMPRIDGSTATIPLISAVRSVLLGIEREEDVTVSGTDYAYQKLINGEADVLLVYAPAEETLVYAKERNVELEMAPIGRDALVFLINVKNRVESLSTEQVIGIYAGEITNWAETGGQDAEIRAYQRPLLSGSQTMMNKLVMKGTPMMEAPPEYIIGDMGGLVEAVAAYDGGENSIGYNVYYYVTRMKLDPNIRLLSVDGIAPSTESISSGGYPFVNDFYAVIRADAPEDSPERVLFDWIQTGDGQELVAHEGYAKAK